MQPLHAAQALTSAQTPRATERKTATRLFASEASPPSSSASGRTHAVVARSSVLDECATELHQMMARVRSLCSLSPPSAVVNRLESALVCPSNERVTPSQQPVLGHTTQPVPGDATRMSNWQLPTAALTASLSTMRRRCRSWAAAAR